MRARIAQATLALDAVATLLFVTVTRAPPIAIPGESDPVEQMWQLIVVSMGAFRIVTWVSFLAWLHRASHNAHALATEPMKHSTGAAIGYWFVPCGNLWLPYQVVAEIDRASDPSSSGRTSNVVVAWWLAWVVASMTLRGLGPIESWGAFARIIAAMLAIRVIERICRNQSESASRRDIHAIAETFV